MNFRPMFDRVLVKQADPETKTSSGFIIPDASVEKANKGTVVSVGPGKVTKDGVTLPMTVTVGENVMFIPGAGIKVKVDEYDLLVMNEEDIIAIVD